MAGQENGCTLVESGSPERPPLITYSHAIARSRCGWLLMISLLWCACCAADQDAATNAPTSKFRSAEDGWLDIGGFIEADYGFLPVVLPISEPAVGYGAAAGPAFIRKAPGASRPNVTVVGGLATENGSWGALAGDSRYWLDGRLQTLVGAVYASVNLDFYGIGRNDALSAQPLRYNLEPKGAMAQAKYRIGESPLWAGLAYGFVSTEVTFDAPPGTPNLPDLSGISKVGAVNLSFSFDTRDNIFTPTRGTYLEAGVGISSQALGGDSEFQRLQILAIQYVPLHPRLSLGLRGQVAAAFGDTPFYLEPFIWMRGVPAMRYQGDSLAQIEAELRWQFWKRFSLVGFVGGGAGWTKFEHFEKAQTAVAGGVGFRYELARKQGIHMGLDVAFGPDDPTIYITIGSAWLRP